MNFVGKIVGRLAFRAFLCCFQKSKVSNGGALQQHRASQDVMFAGSSPVRSAIIKPRKSLTCGVFLCLQYFPIFILSVFCRCPAGNRSLHSQCSVHNSEVFDLYSFSGVLA